MLRVTALELPARFGAPVEQLALASAWLEQAPATDLVLLPEAALTGYVSPDGQFDLTAVAEPLEGPTHHALAALAQRFDCLVVGPLIERDGQRCFNALLGVTPDGQRLLHYRKRHPWFPETWATAGDLPYPLVTWRGTRLTAAICFDAQFLGDESPPALDQADLLLFPSAWVEGPTDPGVQEPSRAELLASLAIAHRTWVLNANWGVGRPRVRGQGGTMVIDALGTVTRGREVAALSAVVDSDR